MHNTNLTPETLAKYFDHTQLKAFASFADLSQLCQECREYGFYSAMIHPANIDYCKPLLAGSGVKIGVVAGFPLGQNTIEMKIAESLDAIEHGAEEIDYVLNIMQLKEKQYDYVLREMKDIVTACHDKGALVKVIFENCYLTDEEKLAACKIALEAQPDFIKTSTGFGTDGATIPDLQLMLKAVQGSGIRVKAAGGVRDLETALRVIDMGVARIGTSSGVAIVEELRRA